MKKTIIILGLILTAAAGFGQTFTQQMLDSSKCSRQWNISEQAWHVSLDTYPDSIQGQLWIVAGDSTDAASVTKTAAADTILNGLQNTYTLMPEATIIEEL